MSYLVIRRLSPNDALKDVIKDIWVFESQGELSDQEMRIIPPSGTVKLVLYDRGTLAGRIGERAYPIAAHRWFVAGVSDRPAIADFDRSRPFRCICFDLYPAAAYRLLSVPQHELRNAIVPLDELADSAAVRTLEERIDEAEGPPRKAMLLQEYLTHALSRTERDAVFDDGAAAIMRSRGLVTMAALMRETALTDRWLRAKFEERLGISPKTFASLTRFQTCFRELLRDKRGFLQSGRFHDFYYDQAHFIKEFRRFLGYSPAKYTELKNDVGEITYWI